MAAVGRLDDLEEFLIGLEPEDAFRLRRVWQFPLSGLNDYTLPASIEERVNADGSLWLSLASSKIELVVLATDVSSHPAGDPSRHYELVYPAHSTPPETMRQAVLASAAVSALVLPLRIGDTIATDGGWVRNFPYEHAYLNPSVRSIASFLYVPSYRQTDLAGLRTMRERLERFRAVPPVRALITELGEAEARAERGEPAHFPEMIVRLMRVAVARNTALEEHQADEHEASSAELRRLRDDMLEIAGGSALPWRRSRVRRRVAERFVEADFPFRHERAISRLTVRCTPGDTSLDPTFRAAWPVETKRALIERGYELTDSVLREGQLADEKAQGLADARPRSSREPGRR
jgi:hypothetical protein